QRRCAERKIAITVTGELAMRRQRFQNDRGPGPGESGDINRAVDFDRIQLRTEEAAFEAGQPPHEAGIVPNPAADPALDLPRSGRRARHGRRVRALCQMTRRAKMPAMAALPRNSHSPEASPSQSVFSRMINVAMAGAAEISAGIRTSRQ